MSCKCKGVRSIEAIKSQFVNHKRSINSTIEQLFLLGVPRPEVNIFLLSAMRIKLVTESIKQDSRKAMR
jgi:hypothetical protein